MIKRGRYIMNDIVYYFGDYNEEIINKINFILGNDFIPYYHPRPCNMLLPKHT